MVILKLGFNHLFPRSRSKPQQRLWLSQVLVPEAHAKTPIRGTWALPWSTVWGSVARESSPLPSWCFLGPLGTLYSPLLAWPFEGKIWVCFEDLTGQKGTDRQKLRVVSKSSMGEFSPNSLMLPSTHRCIFLCGFSMEFQMTAVTSIKAKPCPWGEPLLITALFLPPCSLQWQLQQFRGNSGRGSSRRVLGCC